VTVDGRLTASGTATAIEANLLVVPLEGVDAYEALQRGYAMRIVTRAGTVALSLTGTRAAMDAVLTCVRPYLKPQDPPRADATVLPPAEALVLATNLLAAAGLSGYRIDPPNDNGVTWTLGNGVKGGLIPMRNFRGELDDAAADLIKHLASDCTGEFVSAKTSTPTSDGMVIRKVITACTNY